MIHLFAFLKMLSEVALWYAAGGVVMGLFFPVSNGIPGAFAVALAAGISDFLDSKNEKYRYFGLIPALSGLFLCRSFLDVLLLLAPTVYLCFCVHKRVLQPDATELYYRFRRSVLLSIAACVACTALRQSWGFACSILGLAASVFLMRMLRHDPYDLQNKLLIGMELGLLAAVGAICILLSQDAALAAGAFVLKKVYDYCIYPVFALIIGLSMGVFLVVEWLLGLIAGRQDDPSSAGKGEGVQIIEQFFEEVEYTDNPVLEIVLRIVGVALFLWVAFWVFRKLAEGSERRRNPKPSEETRSAIPVDALRKPDVPGLFHRSAGAKIRKAYAAYCREVTEASRRLIPSDTTRTVNILAKMQEDTDAVELRLLYCRARYDREAVSGEEASRAQALSKALCKKLKSDE